MHEYDDFNEEEGFYVDEEKKELEKFEDSMYTEHSKEEDYDKEYERCFDDFEEGEEIKKEIFKSSIKPADNEEYELDEVLGERGRKPVMSVLNKTKLSGMDMDDLFVKE